MVAMRSFRRSVIAVLLALGACAGAAVGAELLLDDSTGSLVSSAIPPLLGPITETGRTGWNCVPERAATARTAAAAGLPHD
jgi:ABC-type transport system substrate-binding protein